MATRRKTTTQDNVTVRSDGRGTTYIQNNDLAARLKRYRDRTGEYSNKKGGANFTVPTAGQPTSQKRATVPSNNQSARNTGSGQQMRNTGRSVPVQGPLPRESYNFNATTGNRPYVQQPPVNANPRPATPMGQAPASTYQQPNSTAAMGIQPQRRPSMFGGNNYMSSGRAYQPQSPLSQPQSPLAQPQSPLQPSSPLAQSYDPLSSAYRPPIPQSFGNGQAQYGPQPQYTLEEIMQLLQMMNGAGQPATPNNWGRRW